MFRRLINQLVGILIKFWPRHNWGMRGRSGTKIDAERKSSVSTHLIHERATSFTTIATALYFPLAGSAVLANHAAVALATDVSVHLSAVQRPQLLQHLMSIGLLWLGYRRLSTTWSWLLPSSPFSLLHELRLYLPYSWCGRCGRSWRVPSQAVQANQTPKSVSLLGRGSLVKRSLRSRRRLQRSTSLAKPVNNHTKHSLSCGQVRHP